MKVYIDGKFLEKSKATISVFDHGLLYGDGVFEGIRAYNGRVFRLEEHLVRLYHSARAIRLNIPLDIDALRDTVLKTLRVNKLRDAYIRLVVTRGTGDLGLDPRKCPKATIIIITDKITLYPAECYQNGLDLVTVATRRNISDAFNPCIKSLNYLNNILAKLEANRANAPEAIMLNREGYVAECTGDNIFIVRGKRLITPPTSAGALEGITRDVVMELASSSMNLPVAEELFTPYHIYTADEAFLTGTAAEVIPVTRLDDRPIGTGKPGPITQELIARFKKLAQTEGIAI